MTEAVVSTGRPGRSAPGARDTRGAWAGLPDALHAEWTKLRTLASTWWLLLAAAALTVVVSAATAAAYRCSPGAVGGCSPAVTGADPAKISLTGVYLGQVIVALLAVLAVGGEYGTGMIRVTLAATPRRLTVMAAKVLVVSGWALVAGLASAASSLLAGRLILPGHGLSAANGYVVPSLANGADLRAFGGSVLYLVLIALLALGVTLAVRDSAVAIGLVLGLLFLFTVVASVVPSQHLSRHLEQIAPMTTGLYIQTTIDVASLPLTPWQGLGVLALWAVGALLLGAAVLRVRDALSLAPSCHVLPLGRFARRADRLSHRTPVFWRRDQLRERRWCLDKVEKVCAHHSSPGKDGRSPGQGACTSTTLWPGEAGGNTL